MRRFWVWMIGLGLGSGALHLSAPIQAGMRSFAPQRLDERSRDWLRVALWESVNEAELLIRNQSADESDLNKLQREQERVRLYERIPRSAQLERLQEDLRNLAQAMGLSKVRVECKAKHSARTPARALASRVSSEVRYELTAEQLAEEIPIQIVASGTKQQILAWRNAWPRKLLRWVEVDGSPRAISQQVYEIQARVYSFRAVKFPRIELRSARLLLPSWARREPSVFARSEPELWSLVLRSEELIPRAQPLTESRRKFRLEAARLRFLQTRLGHLAAHDAS